MTIYDKVKELATKKELSIAAVESKAEVANGTISGWRSGRPYADTLQKVAKVLEVPIEKLLED